MKEYLINNNGEYELHQGGVVPDGAIEVPEGASTATDRNNEIVFWHKDGSRIPFSGKSDIFIDEAVDKLDAVIVWQRTLSLNDQYAEIEKVRHAHYFKDVSDIDEIDVYEVLHRFGVTDPCLQHIVKKALCAGERGHKDFHTDLKNIADTAQRMLEIHGL